MSPIVFAVIAAAIAPSVLLMLFVRTRDVYDREPLKLVLRVFFLSFLSVIPAVILELPLMALGAFLGAAIGLGIGVIEEGTKLAFVRWLAYRRQEFNEPFDGIVYAVTVSLGFATVENIMYLVPAYAMNRYFVATLVLRTLLTVPMHAIAGVIMGSYVGRAKFAEDESTRTDLLRRSIIVPAALHGLFDVVVLLAASGAGLLLAGAAVIVLVSGVIALRMMHRAQVESPFREEDVVPTASTTPLAA